MCCVSVIHNECAARCRAYDGCSLTKLLSKFALNRTYEIERWYVLIRCVMTNAGQDTPPTIDAAAQDAAPTISAEKKIKAGVLYQNSVPCQEKSEWILRWRFTKDCVIVI